MKENLQHFLNKSVVKRRENYPLRFLIISSETFLGTSS